MRPLTTHCCASFLLPSLVPAPPQPPPMPPTPPHTLFLPTGGFFQLDLPSLLHLWDQVRGGPLRQAPALASPAFTGLSASLAPPSWTSAAASSMRCLRPRMSSCASPVWSAASGASSLLELGLGCPGQGRGGLRERKSAWGSWGMVPIQTARSTCLPSSGSVA